MSDVPTTNSVSSVIRNELKANNVRFYADDNIHEFVTNRLPELEKELTEKFEAVLDTLIIDRENDPNSRETPNRIARMMLYELLSGRYTPPPHLKDFPPSDGEYNGMLVVRAEYKALCASHLNLNPVEGLAYVGILPTGRLLGLSKYTRLVEWHAARGTLQEELCYRIVKAISEVTQNQDVACHIIARHDCCDSLSSITETTLLSGKFQEPGVKAEFQTHVELNRNTKVDKL